MYMTQMGHCGNPESATSKVGMSRPQALHQEPFAGEIACYFSVRATARKKPYAPPSLRESSSIAWMRKWVLQCLLLTSDVTLLEVIRVGFSATSVELEMRADAASAVELLVAAPR